jgi:hypothetical protein
MSRKKPAVAADQPAASAAPPSVPFAIAPKLALPIALAFIAIAIVRIVSTYHVFSSTSDEPAHIACGLEYLTSHTYKLETQHPPLARAFVALLPYLSGTRPRGEKFFQPEGWKLITYEHHPEETMTRMRLGILPFFILGSLVTFFWARRYFGDTVAVIATALFTLIPTVLAHAGLATTDMALTACLGLAFYTLLRWAEQPTPARATLAGFAAGLAALSKFTALGYLPVSAAIALAAWFLAVRPDKATVIALAKQRALGAVLLAATACFTIWAAYFFSWSHGPAPEFFDGIRVALEHNKTGHPAFLLGKSSQTGWWYYFLVALAIKTPLALLILVGAGVAIVARTRSRDTAAWMPVAFALGILLPAIRAHVNIGVRHVMPIYIAFAILGAIACEQLARRRRLLPAVLVAWMAVSGALAHPDYIPYFNETMLIWGPPDQVLVDSDYDWGQDTKRLAARLRELGVTELNWGWVDSHDNWFYEIYPGLPKITNVHPLQPRPGWTAIRPTLERIAQYGLEYRYPDLQPWYMYLQRKETVGTIWLYYVPPAPTK